MLQGLRTVVYQVADLDSATKWYSRMLEIEPYFAEPFYVGFNVGGYELGLTPNDSNASDGNGSSGTVTYWGVENAEMVFKRLIEHGAREHSGVQDVGGGIIVASVFDPFGNVFGIIENPHFSLPEK